MMKFFCAILFSAALILCGGEAGRKPLLLRYQDTFDGSVTLLRYESKDSFRLDSMGRSGWDSVRMEKGSLRVYPSGQEGYEVPADQRKPIIDQVEFMMGHRPMEKNEFFRKFSLTGNRNAGLFAAEWRKTPFGTFPGTFYVRSCGGVTRRFLAEVREAGPVEVCRYRPVPVPVTKKKTPEDAEYLLLTAKHAALEKDRKKVEVKNPVPFLLPGSVTALRPVFLFTDPRGAVYGTETGNKRILFSDMMAADRACFGEAPFWPDVPVPAYKKLPDPDEETDPVLADQAELVDFLEYRLARSSAALSEVRSNTVFPGKPVLRRDRGVFFSLLFPGFMVSGQKIAIGQYELTPKQRYVKYALAVEDGTVDLELENRVLDILRQMEETKARIAQAEELKKLQNRPQVIRRQLRAKRRKALREEAAKARAESAARAAAQAAERSVPPPEQKSIWNPGNWF